MSDPSRAQRGAKALPLPHTSWADIRPARRWKTISSYVQKQMFTFPWADHLQELFVFRAFHNRIDTGEFGAQNLVQVFGLFEQIKGVAHDTWDILFALIG